MDGEAGWWTTSGNIGLPPLARVMGVGRQQHGGMGFGTRNADGERILEFGDAVGMVVCYTFFKKEDSKLITYQSGYNRSMIDYLMVRKTDRCLLKDVKVISSEDCVPQHLMVIGRLVIPMKPQKNKIIKFVPKPRVSKLKDG